VVSPKGFVPRANLIAPLGGPFHLYFPNRKNNGFKKSKASKSSF
jgi:hypothetical protein